VKPRRGASIRIVLVVAGALAVGAAAAVAQRDFSKVEIKTEKLADGLYVLTGAGGNIGVCAGADGVLLVDDQYAEVSDKIKAAVAAVSDRPIRFVFNTHWHGDHTGGNQNLAAQGATIVAHDNVRRRLATEQYVAAWDMKFPPSPAPALPVVTYDDTLTFHLNGEDLVCLHVPNAHTDGDAIVRFIKADVVHMGDCYWNPMYPLIDVSTGGSIDGMIAADDRMLKTTGPHTTFIAGHGNTSGREGLEAFRDMLVTVRDRVRKEIKAKKTLEQIQAAKPLADLDATWGVKGMKADKFLSIVYSDLTRK
jgi:glyoxylase-like metal-dependent hydrolase (beta-lactamase superfamily II)